MKENITNLFAVCAWRTFHGRISHILNETNILNYSYRFLTTSNRSTNMGNKGSVAMPTAEDFETVQPPLDPPFSRTSITDRGYTFRIPVHAWTSGGVIPELGVCIVPDVSAKFYQASRCYIYQQQQQPQQLQQPSSEQVEAAATRLVAVVLSYDSLRVRICTLDPPYLASSPIANEQYNGQPLYEYAFVTKKHDSTQHVMHFRTASGASKPHLVTAKFVKPKEGHGRRCSSSHRAIHAWGDPRQVWAAIYDYRCSTAQHCWQLQTAVGVDPILMVAYCISTDRFEQYVNQQHLRRVATLEAKIDF